MSTDPRIEAATAGIEHRMSWASLHWGDLHPDAYAHLAAAALAAADQAATPEMFVVVSRDVVQEGIFKGHIFPDFTDCTPMVYTNVEMARQEAAECIVGNSTPKVYRLVEVTE